MFKTFAFALVAFSLMFGCSARNQDNPPLPIQLSAAETAYVTSHVVTVGYPRLSVPLAYQNKKGEAAGSGPAYLRAIAKKTGLKLTFVAYDTQALNLEAFQRHETDIALPVKNIPERQVYMNFTQPYTLVNSVMLVHSLPIQFPMQVGFGGKFAIQATLEKLGKQVQVHPYLNDDLSMQALNRGELGAIVLDVPAADYLEHKYQVRYARSPVDFVYDLAFGFQKDNETLGNIISKGLVNLSAREKVQIQGAALDAVMSTPIVSSAPSQSK